MLSQLKWLNLSVEARAKMAKMFGLVRSGGTTVFNNEVISDGYSPKDLLGVSLEKMQLILKSEDTDFYALFSKIEDLVNKEVESEKPKPKEEPEEPLIQVKEMEDGSLNLQVSTKKRGRSAKN